MLDKANSSERDARAQIERVGDILSHHAGVRGERIALFYRDERLTFAEWDRRARQIANGLIAAGVSRDDRVGYIGKNNPRYLEAFFGCAKSGRVLSPISWRLASAEVVDMINDFDIVFVFLDRDFAGLEAAIRANCPRVETIVGVGGASEAGLEFDTWRDRQPDNDPKVSIASEDVLLQLHTSGTTGKPKGAMLTHSNFLHVGYHAETGDVGPWSENDINFIALPFFHSAGSCFTFYGIYVGAGTFIGQEPHPDIIFDAFAAAPITRAGFVPAVIQTVINHPRFSKEQFAKLDYIFYGGSPIPSSLLDQAIQKIGCKFHQFFGMTESSIAGTSLFAQDHDLSRPELLESCGQANSDTEIRIVDSDRNPVPIGETGEIALKSPCIMKGYHKRPKETGEVLVDGWYYTGDAGYLTQDGYLFIRDRLKDMIISGGENIYPAEIEQVLARHPAVLEAGVIGVPSQKWGEETKACVVLRPGQSASEEEIIAFCRQYLAGFKCPKSVDFLPALPRNAGGKILKRQLREAYWKDEKRQVS
jgi:acyl-CoA synthetase (AMP-forming)/AMP-acid ligase II